MSKPKVFVTRVIPAAGLDRVRDVCDADVWEGDLPPPDDVLRDRARDCVGLLTLLSDRIGADVMDACPDLRVISNFAVGYDNVDVDAATERGIAVGNTPGVLTDATADLAFCLLLAAARRLPEARAAVLEGRWKTWEPTGYVGRDLRGATLGVVGLGRIGLALAQRCHGGFGMRVLYCGPTAKPAAERELGAARVPLERLLAESDFVSVHAPLDESTRGMFGAEAFRRMQPGAVFVNTARGGLVDHEALAAALRSGEIFAAGLDVTDPEPFPPDHALLSLPNAVVLPHIGSATVRARDAMAEIAAQNLIAGAHGSPLPHPVAPPS